MCSSARLVLALVERLVCQNPALTDTGVVKSSGTGFQRLDGDRAGVSRQVPSARNVLNRGERLMLCEMGQGGRAKFWQPDTLTGAKNGPEEKLMCIKGEQM